MCVCVCVCVSVCVCVTDCQAFAWPGLSFSVVSSHSVVVPRTLQMRGEVYRVVVGLLIRDQKKKIFFQSAK